jgi:antitoxin HicB
MATTAEPINIDILPRFGKACLARRLRWHLPQVARVLDLRHASKIEQVEAALAALGLRLIVDVARAA